MTAEVKEIEVVKLPNFNAKKTTKRVYLVEAEDPTIKEKKRIYLMERLDKVISTAEMTGYEIDNKITAQINKISYEDLMNLAKKNNERLIIHIPWHRIITIKIFDK